MKTKRIGIMTSVKTVDVSKPPMTTTAMLVRVSDPAVMDRTPIDMVFLS